MYGIINYKLKEGEMLVVIETKIVNQTTDVWKFEVGEIGYIDLVVNDMYMDTMYDMGVISDVNHLEKVVRRLLKCWKVNSYELVIKA